MVGYEILNMKIFNQLLSLIDQLLFLVNIGCHLEKCFPGRRDIHENIFSSFTACQKIFKGSPVYGKGNCFQTFKNIQSI